MTTKPTIYIIKKKGGHGGHHGGAWKVAYADFVTAMMALFIVLWLLNTSKAVQEAVAGYFKDPAGTANKVGSSVAGSGEKILMSHDNMSQLKDKLEKALKQMPNFEKVKKHVVMTITNEGLRIELTESASGTFFDSGSPNLNSDGREIINILAEELGKLPNKLALEGHTDSSPFADGRNYGNWELSADRANSTRRLMQQNGIRADQVTQVRGFADQRLLKPEAPMDPSNRRISVIVLYQQPAGDASNATLGTTEPQPSDAPGKKPDETGAAALPDSKVQSSKPPSGKPAEKPASPTMNLDEIRKAVEKMDGKTPPPTSPPRDKPKQ
jgi:chemotaxis protein MotB